MGERRDKAARVDGCGSKSAARRARRQQQGGGPRRSHAKPKRAWAGTKVSDGGFR